jgi:hypothetical protein
MTKVETNRCFCDAFVLKEGLGPESTCCRDCGSTLEGVAADHFYFEKCITIH